MRLLIVCFLAVNLFAFSGCSTKNGAASRDSVALSQTQAEQGRGPGYASPNNASVAPNAQMVKGTNEDGSLAKADNAQAASEAIERKIIRNGKLTIETDSPTEGQGKITSIAESFGGFVINSEFKQSGPSSGESVVITVRVPAAQFNEALEKIRPTGDRVLNENITGQDVTEEFLDLEARIKTQKALEAQFLEIMKQSKGVSDALEVQTEISKVRTEIERMEGRKRFLQNQATLSTIIVTLQTPPSIVSNSTTGFGHKLKQAFADGMDIATLIVLGLIQLIIVLIPITLFIFLPLGLILRLIVRRLRNNKKSAPVAQPQS